MALSLTPLPGLPRRALVLLDGKPVKQVSCSIVSLPDVSSLPDGEALQRLHELEVKGGIRYAVAHLARQSTHSKVLERALRRHYLESEVIAEVVEYCTKQGWLNDKEWVERHVEVWQARGKSPLAIEAFLQSKGISSKLCLDEQAALRSLIKRRFPQLLSPELSYPERARIFRSLQRRGFSLSAVQQFLRESSASLRSSVR